MVVGVQGGQNCPLAQVRLAGYGPGLTSDPLQRRQQDCHQQRNDPDDHQQLDQGEAMAIGKG